MGIGTPGGSIYNFVLGSWFVVVPHSVKMKRTSQATIRTLTRRHDLIIYRKQEPSPQMNQLH